MGKRAGSVESVVVMQKWLNAFRGKRVLLTGHTGFKGSWLSLWLLSLGAEVSGYALAPHTNPAMFDLCRIGEDMESVLGDIRDHERLAQVMRECRPEVVFHLAAQPLVRYSYTHARETYETNVMGTIHVLEAAKNTETVQTVVVITSDKCYENKEWVYGYRETDPMGGYDPYSSSKGCAELVVSAYRQSFFKERGIALASARAGNVFGGGDWAEDRLIPDFVRAVAVGQELVIRNPNAIRPWQHVLEPLSGYLQLAAVMLEDRERYAGAWNFGPNSQDTVSVGYLLQRMIKLWGKGAVREEVVPSLHEANLLKLDISKAEMLLKWHSCCSLEEAMHHTIEWYEGWLQQKDVKEITLAQIAVYSHSLKNSI